MQVCLLIAGLMLAAVLGGCTSCLNFNLSPSPSSVLSTTAQESYAMAREERTTATVVSDNKISLAIGEKFAEDNPLRLLDLSVHCYRGDVFLVGEYKTPAQKARAIEIASQVEGVRSVTTYLLMKDGPKDCGTFDRLMIKLKVRAGLIADRNVRSTNIDIDVVQCRVVLLGIVRNQQEIDRAFERAGAVKGVAGVESLLEAAGP